MTEQTHNKLYIFLICVVLVVATVTAYEPIRHNKFVDYDDNLYVTKNPNVQGGITPQSVIWAFTTLHAAFWHPLTQLSHMLDCQLFGLKPLGHHATSLLLHIANTLLLFWVLKSMTSAVWPSAFVAAAFALHPLHVESVAWVAQRKDVLSSLFWMLTMAAYVRYVRHQGLMRYLLVIVFFCLGMMAKPMLVTLPFVLLLLDYWPLNRFQLSWQSKGKTLRLIAEKVPLFVIAAVLSVIAFIAQRNIGSLTAIDSLSLKARVANATVSYTSYIFKMIYPTRLAPFYPHPAYTLPKWQAIVSLIVLIAISAAIIYTARRWRYLTVGWLWYLGTLVPVSGLVKVGSHAMADRYTYIPLIGLFIIIAWAAAETAAKWRHQKLTLAIPTTLLLAALLICTRTQVRYWKNTETLFAHTVKVTEKNFVAYHNLALALHKQGRLDEATEHYIKASQIRPKESSAYYNLGIALYQKGDFNGAIDNWKAAVRYKPDHYSAHRNLAGLLSKQGRIDEAIKHYRDALRLKPNDDVANVDLAEALAKKGRLDEAVKLSQKALQLNPDNAKAPAVLALALYQQGRIDHALPYLTQAVRLKPDDFLAHKNLAQALAKKGRFDDAIKQYHKALWLKPDSPEAQNNLAWILAAQLPQDRRNPAKALTLAKRACELTNYNQPAFLKTLAAAYAAAGRFSEAVTTAERALELAISSEQKQLAQKIRIQLKLYRTGQPLSQSP